MTSNAFRNFKYEVISLLGILFLLGATGFTNSSEDTLTVSVPFEWLGLEQAQKMAAESGKTVFVFVEAEWCVYCRQMKREVFPDETVTRLIEEYYHPVSIDLDSREKILFNGEEMTERQFARKMNVTTTPTLIFVSPDGEELGRQLGYNPTDRFRTVLEFVQSDQFGSLSFEEYMKRNQANDG